MVKIPLNYKELLKLPPAKDKEQLINQTCCFVASTHKSKDDGLILQICLYDYIDNEHRLVKRVFCNKKKDWFTYFPEKNKLNTTEPIRSNSHLSRYYCANSSDETDKIIKKFFASDNIYSGISFIHGFQEARAHEKRRKKERELETEANKRIARTHKLEIPDSFCDWIRDKVLPTDKIIIYKGYRCHCALCGTKYTLGYKPSQGTKSRCVNCGEVSTFVTKYSADGGSYEYVSNVAYLHRVDNDFVIRVFHLNRDPDAEYADIKSNLEEFARYYYEPQKTYMFRNEYKWGMSHVRERCNSYSFYKKVEIYDGGYHFMAESFDNLKGTFFERQIDSFKTLNMSSNRNPIMMLYKFNTWPALEYLAKLGYVRLVLEVVNGRRREDMSISLYQRKANSVLGVPHSILSKFNHDKFLERDIKAIKQLIEMGKLGQLTAERVDFICSTLTNNSLDPLGIFRNFGVEKVCNYIYKQAALKTENDRMNNPAADYTPKETWKDFQDYRTECHTLGYDITNEGVLFPKDMYAAHSRASELIAAREWEKRTGPILADFKKKVKKYIKKEFTNGELVFRICREPLELKREGEALRHCVYSAGYDKRIAEGRTLIFFIRRAQAPDTPFYTLECQPQSFNVVQLRGCRNDNAPNDVYAFAQECLDKLKAKTIDDAIAV